MATYNVNYKIDNSTAIKQSNEQLAQLFALLKNQTAGSSLYNDLLNKIAINQKTISLLQKMPIKYGNVQVFANNSAQASDNGRNQVIGQLNISSAVFFVTSVTEFNACSTGVTSVAINQAGVKL